MKYFYLVILATLFSSCLEKTEENSKYAEYIADLTDYFEEIDSVYDSFSKVDIDSLIAITKLSDQKYKKVKSVYVTDSIEPEYEKIMLLVRGQLVKKLKNVNSEYSSIKNEYQYCKKQYSDLKENLIHETIEDDNAHIFYNEEKNAMIILNGEMINFMEIKKETYAQYPTLHAQLDSIITLYDNN